MNKEYLKEHNLLESQRQFRKLCEYTFIGADDVLSEDDVEDDAQNNQNQQSNYDNSFSNVSNFDKLIFSVLRNVCAVSTEQIIDYPRGDTNMSLNTFG